MMIHKYDGYGPDGLRRLYKGGGGGSAKYDNLEELYKEQTESARLLREQAEANLPGAVKSYVDETKQVLDPGYAETQAARATLAQEQPLGDTQTLPRRLAAPSIPRSLSLQGLQAEPLLQLCKPGATGFKQLRTDRRQVNRLGLTLEQRPPVGAVRHLAAQQIFHQTGLLAGGNTQNRQGLTGTLIDPARRYLRSTGDADLDPG